MPKPTKKAVLDFMYANETFFATPLTDQKGFSQYYTDKGKLDDISDYSTKLMDVLQKVIFQSGNYSAPVWALWKDQKFEQALDFPEVRQFIYDNQNHPAIVAWQEEHPPIQVTKQKAETSQQAEASEYLSDNEIAHIGQGTKNFREILDSALTFVEEQLKEYNRQLGSTNSPSNENIKRLEEAAKVIKQKKGALGRWMNIQNLEKPILRDEVMQTFQDARTNIRRTVSENLTQAEQEERISTFGESLLETISKMDTQSSQKQFITLLKGDLDRTTYIDTLSKSLKHPQKTVFIFPGNVNHHKPGTTLKSHKAGNGLGKVADQLTSGPNPLPVLSLPTKGMEKWPIDPVQNAIVESAVLDIWRAVGAGYDLALPVRERDQKNQYFESGLDSDDAYEPSFWGGVVGGKNLELAEMYRQQLNLVEIIGPVLKSKENRVQFLEQLHNRIGQASPSDDPDVERLSNIMIEKLPNPEFLKKMVVSMAAGCNKQENDPWFESTKPMEHDVSALITESKIKQAQIEKELAQQ